MRLSTARLSLAAVAVALLLAACTVEIVELPPIPDDIVDTTDDDLVISGEYNLRPGRSVTVQVNVRTALDLVVIELNQDIDLEVQVNTDSTVRRTIASSSSREFFAAGDAGLGMSAAGASTLDTQAINVPWACEGSCVALRAASHNRLFARITNTSGTEMDITLRAFGSALRDTTEPENDSATGAPSLSSGGDEQGAIETIGDIDHYRVLADGEVLFVANHPALDLVLRARDVTGEVFGPYRDGDTFVVMAGDILWVESNLNRAAAAGASRYAISHNP